jgi:Peptidase family M1 domain
MTARSDDAISAPLPRFCLILATMKRLFLFIALIQSVTGHTQPVWQQRVDTKIDVSLDDKGHYLRGNEEFTYTNNSPDTLRYIYIHLWPNAYKNDHTAFERQQAINHNTAFYFSQPEDKGMIDSLQFTIDGLYADYNSSEDEPDIARIDLTRPLLPGRQMKVSTPFRVKVPKVFSRMGHTGQAYYISQWFPKPAVYDIRGWHPIPYLDQGEFYSEYGSYDVNITLPANYVVMATGNLLDDKENKWLDELAARPLPDSSKLLPHTDTFPPSATELKTLHYHEDNVHDFAWFADKRWLVRKDTVVSPGNGQLVTTWAAFMPSYSRQWRHATQYLKETVRHYGRWVGPYPYKTIKAVLGDMHAGGGMEYPTVTIIDKSAQSQLRTTVIHEAGHNWFYGMLGSNERDHAWMDEGINTFYEEKTSATLEKQRGVNINLNEFSLYLENVATHNDQAIEQTSANFEKLNYGIDVYYKTAAMLRWLEQYMGEADFEQGMHDYYDTWRYHHPYPDDLRVCLQRHTSKPLGWFFDTILHTDKRIDYKITKARTEGDSTIVTVKNNTGVAAPVKVNEYSSDSLTGGAWMPPFTGKTTVSLPGTAWNSLRVDDVIPDAKTDNNEYRRRALFHHFGLKVKPVLGTDQGYSDKLFIAPALGYNQYDGFMVGLLIHNLTLPENRFRYAIAPLYGIRSNSLVGAGSVGYLWYPSGIFREIMLQADGKTFHNNETSGADPVRGSYDKVAPSLSFTFNEHDPLSPVRRTLLLKAYYINEQNIFLADSAAKPSLVSAQNTYALARYSHRNNRTYNPFNYTIEGQAGADFAKLTAEGNIRIDYNKPKKSLYVRAFLGKFFPISNDLNTYSRYELNASYSGIDDYLYDGAYFGRNAQTGIAAQQVSMQEGGFKVPVFNNTDRSDDWMATINLKTDLPISPFIPIRIFFDAGLIPNANPSFTHSGTTTLIYEGGLELHIIKDFVSVYLPIIMSNDPENYIINTYGKKNLFARSISFTFDLQQTNWLKTPASIFRAGS